MSHFPLGKQQVCARVTMRRSKRAFLDDLENQFRHTQLRYIAKEAPARTQRNAGWCGDARGAPRPAKRDYRAIQNPDSFNSPSFTVKYGLTAFAAANYTANIPFHDPI